MCQNSFSIIWFSRSWAVLFFSLWQELEKEIADLKADPPHYVPEKATTTYNDSFHFVAMFSFTLPIIVDMILGGISRWLDQGSVLNFLAAPSFTNFLECNKGHAKTLSLSVTVSKDSTDSIRIVSTYFIVWSLKPYQKVPVESIPNRFRNLLRWKILANCRSLAAHPRPLQ